MSPLSGFSDTTLPQESGGLRRPPFERVALHVDYADKASRTRPPVQGPSGRRKCV